MILIQHLARESYQRVHIVIALQLTVGFDGHKVAYCMGTACCHHHGLCLTLHGRKRHLSELLYDNCTLLVNDMLVVIMECFYRPCSRCLFIFGILTDTLCYLIAHTIGGITQQHVLDEPFLNSL